MEYRLSAKCAVPEEWKAGIGHDFRHYKGKMYRLLGLAPHRETLEPMAVYQLLYGDFGLWVGLRCYRFNSSVWRGCVHCRAKYCACLAGFVCDGEVAGLDDA